MKKKDKGLTLSKSELKKVTHKQRIQQWWYGVIEPYLIRWSDKLLSTEKGTQKYLKTKKPLYLPAGVIISTEAACNFVDFIYAQNTENTTARMAVTKCVCQTALNRYCEPVWKDMSLLYAADMYTTIKHTGINEKFHVIETAEKAKEMLKEFDKIGLIHNVMYCHASGKWTFVMCNCDSEICIPYRSHMAGRRTEFYPGPEIVALDETKCLGEEKCGKCLDRCKFKACSFDENGKPQTDFAECLGCGLCVSTCPTKARTLIQRDDYKHEDVITTDILLGKK